jgi:DNA helicase II / ATP-dependent DNA helicase PcrA
MRDIDPNLTPDQRSAVEHLDGPCLVVAGAGTGKTKVISERIANLILNHGVEPEQILALTFTDKAAGEMEERVDTILPYGMFGTAIGTFHSFCHDLVRRHAFSIGVDPNARLVGKAEEVSLLRANQRQLPLKLYKPPANPVSFLRQLASFMDRAKEEQISPEMLRDHGVARRLAATDEAEIEAAERTIELANCYEIAAAMYVKANILTYADLIANSLRILKESALARKEEQERFRYILIDEFQDTNTTQAEICYLLAGERANIFVVGDDDQAIYRFRGANLDNILGFRERYPQASLITLRDNFRSAQGILDASYRLIQNNNPYRLEARERIDKRLVAKGPAADMKSSVEVLHFSAGAYEQEGVARRIEALMAEGFLPGEIAILARGHAHLDGFEHELRNWNIPVNRHKDGSFYALPTVERALSYLRFLIRPDDSYNLFFLLSEPPFSLDLVTLRDLNVAGRKLNNSLWEQLEIGELPEAFGEARRYLAEKLGGEARRATDALRDYLFSSGWDKQLASADDREAFNSLNTLYNEARAFEQTHRPVVLAQYLSHVDELIASGEDIKVESELSEESDGVHLMTVHGSKGLEFRAVFVVNMVSDRFPGANRSSGLPLPEELVTPQVDKVKYEEERRLGYVALTRAKERLYLTHSNRYEGNKREKKPSPFLAEAIETMDESIHDQPLRVTGVTASDAPKAQLFAAPRTYSASALEAFEESPRRYLEDYIYRLPHDDSSSASFGTAVHEVLNGVFSALRAGTRFNETEIEAQFAKSWRPEGFEHKEQEREWYAEGLVAVKGYLANIADDFVPDRLEQPVELTLPDGIKIIGKVDRIDRDADGTVRIIDYKTGRKTATHADIKKNLPIALYAAALAQRGETVGSVGLHYLMTGDEVALPVDSSFTAGAVERAREIIVNIEEAYRTNEWPEGNTFWGR